MYPPYKTDWTVHTSGCGSKPQSPSNGTVCILETMQFVCFQIAYFGLNYRWLLTSGETLALFFWAVEPPEIHWRATEKKLNMYRVKSKTEISFWKQLWSYFTCSLRCLICGTYTRACHLLFTAWLMNSSCGFPNIGTLKLVHKLLVENRFFYFDSACLETPCWIQMPASMQQMTSLRCHTNILCREKSATLKHKCWAFQGCIMVQGVFNVHVVVSWLWLQPTGSR